MVKTKDRAGERPPASFDERAWKKAYMRKYMKEWRKRRMAQKDAAREDAK